MKKALAFALTALLILSSLALLIPVTGADDYDTSIPTFIYDFAGSLYDSVIANVSFTMKEIDKGLRLTAIQDDPSIAMVVPRVPMEQLLYVNIRYRVELKGEGRYAEIYYSASNGETYAEPTKMTWDWENVSGEWDNAVVHLESFEGKEGVYLTGFRFDALAGGRNKIVQGEIIDLGYMAFFETEEDAARFNYDEYCRYLDDKAKEPLETEGETQPRVIEPGDWQQPDTADAHYCAEDIYPGSLQMVHNDDGTMTISYLLNGETVTYTVPDTVQYASGPLVGTDDLGRSLWNQYTVVDPDYTRLDVRKKADGTAVQKYSEVDSEPFTVGTAGARENRDIGLFYFLWLGEHGDSGIQDITKIIEQYGVEAAGKADCPGWGPPFSIHHFAEPLYGYYYSIDTWVMRKHVELLCNAGVDFLYFDTTNNYAYSNNALNLMSILHEFNQRGYEAPKVCFYTHTGADERVRTIYHTIYEKGFYPDTWYYWEGKPVIIAPADCNIDDFFTTREPQWPNQPQQKDAWPWIDWNWPQKVYRNGKSKPEAVSVSVAQHAGNGCFSESALYGYQGNWGRSFNGTNDLLTEDSYKLGLNIQNEFNYAMTVETPIVMVTGWNEWIAGRQAQIREGQPIVFIDTFNYEYSRDIEMSRGGYFDNYYMQLISNISALKGAAPVLVQDARNVINVTGGFDQWDNVTVTYNDPAGDTVERDSIGYGHVKLTDTSGRNDITAVRMTNDTTYLYVYIRTDDTVVRPAAGEKSTWMQVYLNVDGQTTGWYGFDYLLNANPKSDTLTTLAAFTGDGCAVSDKCEVAYRVLGNEMMFAVPLEALGITEYDRICVEFKAADSDTLIDEMEDFYIEGDAAPLGRPNFVYQTYIPGVTTGDGHAVVKVSDKQVMPTAPVTEAGTQADTAEPVTAPADAETDAAETAAGTDAEATEAETEAGGGCKSAVGMSVALVLLGAWAVLKKKD